MIDCYELIGQISTDCRLPLQIFNILCLCLRLILKQRHKMLIIHININNFYPLLTSETGPYFLEWYCIQFFILYPVKL